MRLNYDSNILVNVKNCPKNMWKVLGMLIPHKNATLPVEIVVIELLYAGCWHRMLIECKCTLCREHLPINSIIFLVFRGIPFTSFSSMYCRSQYFILYIMFLFLSPTCKQKIEGLILNLKNRSASDVDEISSKAMKAICKFLGNPLRHILNCML